MCIRDSARLIESIMRSEHQHARALVWALPVPLAATPGITVVFSSSGYLDVSVHPVPLLDVYKRQDLDSLAVPDNLGLRCGQLLQAVQRLLRLHGLHRSQDGVHGDHHEDNQRTLRISQETGDNGGEDQDCLLYTSTLRKYLKKPPSFVLRT